MSSILAAARTYFEKALGPEKGLKVYQVGERIFDPAMRVEFYKAAITDLECIRLGKPAKAVAQVSPWKYQPVDIVTFVEDPYFLNAKGILYPEVIRCLEEMNNGTYVEAVLTGAIGTGKTTIAIFSTAYQLYLLSCYKNPHSMFGLDPSSEIVFIFQSLNAKLAKAVDYERFKAMLEKSPYFHTMFPFNTEIASELKFPNRIIVKPVSGQETAAIGQNVIGGIIDEINFMAVIENSKASMDGGTFDQAIALYNSISRRRKSRFMSAGKLPGLLCLVSSKRYPGQFTDRKEAEAQREIELTGKTGIYVYDKKSWEIKPKDAFSGEWFNVYAGSESKKPRILAPGEGVDVGEEHLMITIPEEYRLEFEADIMNALRDIAGVSTLAKHPFIVNTDSIHAASRKGGIIFGRDVVDFEETRLKIMPRQFYKPDLPRFVHIDLALSGDSAGICIGTVTGFKEEINAITGTTGMMPNIYIDGVLEVKPPKNDEIKFYKIREALYVLKKMGLNIRWITFDQFQSVDSMQLLKQAGFQVGRQSMDITCAPYDFTKNALYDGRLNMPEHAKLKRELASLEKDTKKNKIDHPPHSSKDLSDALAGVVYGLTMRRELWNLYNVPLMQLPESVRSVVTKVISEGESSGKAMRQ